MRNISLGLMVLAAAPSLFATSVAVEPCPSGQNLAHYVLTYTLSAGGCSVGDWTYTNFSYALVSFPTVADKAPGTLKATAFDINMFPPADVTQAFGFTSNKFDVEYNAAKNKPNTVVYKIGYTIDPYPPVIPGFETEMDTFTPSGGGRAVIQTDICVHLKNSPACAENKTFSVEYDSKLGGNIKLKNFVGFTPTNWIDVLHTITFEALVPGSKSQITGLKSQVVNNDGSDITLIPTPEPASIALGGLGLCLLGLLRRRR